MNEPVPSNEVVRIGYHRRSDGSVSSSVWDPGPLRDRFLQELSTDQDVLSAWWRRLPRVGEHRHPRAHYFKSEEVN